MKKMAVSFLFVLAFMSCRQQVQDVAIAANPPHKATPTVKPPQKKVLGDYMECNDTFFWEAKQTESAESWVRVVFKEDVAHYQINGQCIYSFLTNYYHTGADKVELLWSYKTDCLRDKGFLSKPNGVKHFPKPGDAFCEYSLVNDSVIKVKYNFPEWAAAVNKTAKDSIFPHYLYLAK
jgi:hypothetical protein